MRRLMLALALLAATPAFAASYRLGTLEASQPWSRPAAAGMNGAGYLSVSNKGTTPETLNAVETPAATRVEIHRMSMGPGGVMSMKPEAGPSLAPGQTVMFGPGGLHLMLIGLKQPLKVGDSFPATLVFASGARLKVAFKVGLAAPMGGMAHDHAGMAH